MIARAIGPGAESHAALPPSGPFGISSQLRCGAGCICQLRICICVCVCPLPLLKLPTPTKRPEPGVWFGLIWSGLIWSDLIRSDHNPATVESNSKIMQNANRAKRQEKKQQASNAAHHITSRHIASLRIPMGLGWAEMNATDTTSVAQQRTSSSFRRFSKKDKRPWSEMKQKMTGQGKAGQDKTTDLQTPAPPDPASPARLPLSPGPMAGLDGRKAVMTMHDARSRRCARPFLIPRTGGEWDGA
ncbi:hypothetical protein N7481_003269 [Penicillium waksmanii]|uniref:uncharacterized protein n=1 Tax=Penicillium waksmanii TaxID=69791 RepID=UPI00254921E1|nr:uncharacterized protein N7481_003269 [Penicillium waksmanii]KAJ5988059.1 hypothetical protein N7481_003269 [Penicillium waksmanii]